MKNVLSWFKEHPMDSSLIDNPSGSLNCCGYHPPPTHHFLNEPHWSYLSCYEKQWIHGFRNYLSIFGRNHWQHYFYLQLWWVCVSTGSLLPYLCLGLELQSSFLSGRQAVTTSSSSYWVKLNLRRYRFHQNQLFFLDCPWKHLSYLQTKGAFATE